ncbi:hypothetical protein ACFW5U_27820 [Streptomyces rochei]|uniref:hypothetical protein n=1 Tax=Streptomyces rochei TaxID=1928 RepID=UPI0036A59C92
MTDQTTDRHTCHNQKTATGPAWKCPRCSLPPADQTAPLADRLAHPEAVREQVRRALDFTYAVSLGYESSDQLLATYDASRAPADQTTPLRDRIAETIWAQYPDAEPSRTGLVMANPHAVADAVLAVLPAPADQAAVLRKAADVAERLMDERYGPDCSYAIGGLDVARELRRMADETATTETGRGCPSDCPCRAVCIGPLKPAAGARQDGARP